MSLCHNQLLPRRGLTAVICLVAAGVVAEPIRFSSPAVPIAAPAREQVGLPEARTRDMDFSSPNMDRPMAPRPSPAIRMRPRDDRDREDRPWLQNESKKFSDPGEKGMDKATANPFAPERKPSPWSRDNIGMQRPETPRALSPVTEFGWDPRNPSTPKSTLGAASAFGNQHDERPRTPFATLEEPGRVDARRASPMFDMLGTRVREKEKLTVGQVTRAAEFQQMLNPGTVPPERAPGALEPVVAVVGTPRNPAPLTIPTIGGSTVSGTKLDPRLADPMTVFNNQNSQLRGPVFAEFDKKPAPQANRPSAAASFDARFQTPLNRQPTIHEFPKRKF